MAVEPQSGNQWELSLGCNLFLIQLFATLGGDDRINLIIKKILY